MLNNFTEIGKDFIAYLCKDVLILNNPRILVKSQQVNLHWWSLKSVDGTENLGDWLSNIIYNNMLKLHNIKPNQRVKETKHLYAIGSILGFGYHHATVWGSGILHANNIKRLKKVRLDIRCVRGPETRRVLTGEGFSCPAIYGDPAILLPLFYKPLNIKKKRAYTLILHYSSNNINKVQSSDSLNILTKDYKSFVDRIVESELVISSSLHGIILAESYGVPAILLKDYDLFNSFKYRDYYLSTNRTSINTANSIEEALRMTPSKLPNLAEMQQGLIDAFPYDLWR